MNLFEQSLDKDTSLTLESYGPGIEVSLFAGDVFFVMRGLFENVGAEIIPAGASAPITTLVPTLHVQKSCIDAAIGRPLHNTDRFFVHGTEYRVQYALDDGHGLLRVAMTQLSKKDVEASPDGL